MAHIWWSSDFTLYLEDYLMYERHILGSWVSMSGRFISRVVHCDPHFMGQWFCLISWKLFDVWTSFGIMSQYDQTFDLKINVGHCDIYFMVQWFCVISLKLFDVWTSYFGIKGQYDAMFDLKINVGDCGLYFMAVILPYISKIIWWISVIFSDNETVWPKLWPQNIAQHPLYVMV